MARQGCAAALVTALAAVAVASCSGTAQSPGRSTSGDGSATSATVPPVRSVTIGASGDVLPHAPVLASARARTGGTGYDFAPSFAQISAQVRAADVSICHLETPLSPEDTDLTQPGIKVFNTPHEIADDLADAGYDGCDFASNHTWDRGLPGLVSTRTVLRSAGLQYAGPSPTDSPHGDVAWYETRGLRVAQLAYTYTVLNNGSPNTELPPEAPWLDRSMWLARGADGIREDARAARAEGADFVVVSMHWGDEYVTTPNAQQRELAAGLLDSPDVDLVLGTHVHVVQPCERVNGKYVFYGLGNSLSNQSPQADSSLRPETQEGLFVTATLTKEADGTVSTRATYQPTRVDLDGHVIERATRSSHPETFERTTATLRSLGKGTCPIRPAG